MRESRASLERVTVGFGTKSEAKAALSGLRVSEPARPAKEREMSTILTTVEKLERETRTVRHEVYGRLAVAAVSLGLALSIAYAVVAGFTQAGVL